jgi:hypothetical protein
MEGKLQQSRGRRSNNQRISSRKPQRSSVIKSFIFFPRRQPRRAGERPVNQTRSTITFRDVRWMLKSAKSTSSFPLQAILYRSSSAVLTLLLQYRQIPHDPHVARSLYNRLCVNCVAGSRFSIFSVLSALIDSDLDMLRRKRAEVQTA